MELREYLDIGAKKAGGLTALGELLGQGQTTMSAAKAHKRPLPLDAAVKLADYIGADLRTVIAANELATEKKEEKRSYWLHFVNHAKAASFAGFLITASVLNLLTPTPAEASDSKGFEADTICIM